MRIKLIIFLILPIFSFAQFQNKKVYNIQKINTATKIDGKLEDDIWNELDIAKDFTQVEPNNGIKEKNNHERKSFFEMITFPMYLRRRSGDKRKKLSETLFDTGNFFPVRCTDRWELIIKEKSLL